MTGAPTTEQQLRIDAARLMQRKRTLAESLALLESRMEIMRKEHEKLRIALRNVIDTARAALNPK